MNYQFLHSLLLMHIYQNQQCILHSNPKSHLILYNSYSTIECMVNDISINLECSVYKYIKTSHNEE